MPDYDVAIVGASLAGCTASTFLGRQGAKVALIERVVSGAWGGHPIEELEQSGVSRIVSIGRYGTAQVPRPSMVVQEGDVLHLAAAGEQLAQIDAHLSGPAKVGH